MLEKIKERDYYLQKSVYGSYSFNLSFFLKDFEM